MKAMFKPQSLANLQSVKHSQRPRVHHGGSAKPADIVDVDCVFGLLENDQLKCGPAHPTERLLFPKAPQELLLVVTESRTLVLQEGTRNQFNL